MGKIKITSLKDSSSGIKNMGGITYPGKKELILIESGFLR
tara:strand:- start:267 stop:386 length:120 start_codon:yes stop_codon:yes gene_type:complete